MARSYTKKECCQLLAVSYRDLAKLLTRANIVVTVASNDHRAQVITEDQLATLRQLVALDGRQPPSDSVPSSDLLARIEALESLVQSQGERIASLEAAQRHTRYNAPVRAYDAQQTALPPVDTYSTVPTPESRFKRSFSGQGIGDTFPPDWLTVQDIERDYGIAATTLRNAIEKGYIPAHKGEWKRGNHKPKAGIDSEQLSYILSRYRPDLGQSEQE